MLTLCLRTIYLFLFLFLFLAYTQSSAWAGAMRSQQYQIMVYGDDLAFTPDMKALLGQEVQYSLKVFDGPIFEDETFSQVNIFNETYPSDAVVIASKMAFVVRDVPSSFFNEDFFVSKEFTEKTVNNAQVYPIKNSYDLKVVKPSKGYMGTKISVTGIVNHTYYPTPTEGGKANAMLPKQVDALMSFDSALGDPSSIAVSFLSKCDKFVYNTYSIFKFFPTEDGKSTLVIHYQAVSLKTKDLWFVPKSNLKKMFTSEVSEGLEYTAKGLQSYGK